MKKESFRQLITHVRQCTACEGCLPLGPRPIIQVNNEAKLLIIGQAPGLKVHQTGIPWNDASGERLREWLGLSNETFYDEKVVAILPMGFCYPGKGERGDLPPRKECFNLWHDKLIARMPNIKLVLLFGSYAQNSYLKDTRKRSLTETVRAWEEYLPRYIPFPHPSPLNNIWLHKNSWFKKTMLPSIQKIIKSALST
jgi:uracil-DNA glycosylase